jgi:hypothetical protein
MLLLTGKHSRYGREDKFNKRKQESKAQSPQETLLGSIDFEALPLFAKSGRMAKRIKRMERIGTDFDSPAADRDEPKASQSPFLSV